MKRPYTVTIKDKARGGAIIPVGEIMARTYRQAFTMTRRRYSGWFSGNETMSHFVEVTGQKKTVGYPAVSARVERKWRQAEGGK